MIFYNLNDFLRLSAVLNYQLSARTIDWNNVLTIILGERTILAQDKPIVIEVFKYLNNVYGQRKRQLGPRLILHPLRSAALLARVTENPTLVDLMTVLLHDNFEDIKPKNILIANWRKIDSKFQSLLKHISQPHIKYLMERLEWLTKEPDVSYYQYIGELLDSSSETPEVVRVKLADRLDNTLDMRIEIEDPLLDVDFFEVAFQIMFSSTYTGYKPKLPHPPPAALNGAQRLYQLFKHTILLSLIRQKKSAENDPAALKIFNHLAIASMREAQRIALHIFGYHENSTSKIRQLMIETMDYVQNGGIESITSPSTGALLDGLFISIFDSPNKKIRLEKLAALYKEKPLMIETAIAFIVIFLSFQNDSEYYVKGISPEGIRPEKKNK